MGSRISLALRLLAALAVASTVLVLAEPATALTVPETLAERRPVRAGPVESTFPIDSVGVIWDAPHGDADEHGHADEEVEGAHGAVRFRTDGVWGPWIDLVEDGAAAEGQWASALVDGDDADAYQVRGIPMGARSARAVAINTTDGPAVKVGERPASSAGALASTMCRSRADWGADESLRFSKGTEIWPAELHPVQVLSVHHTATANGETGEQAAARLRSIYRYHAIDRGWGDIGYQYLIDAAGVVYEGRWSGETSASCAAGGNGSDFGHESATGDGDALTDEMVGGAHIGGHNSGNMGVSLLGTFTPSGSEPTTAAVDALETVLAELGSRHGLDPQGKVDYVNPVNGYKKTVDTISAHRDWAATECPGDRLYAQLPDIRTAVAAAMAGGGTEEPPADEPEPAPLTVTGTDRGTSNPLRLGTGQPMVVSGSGFAGELSVKFINGKGPAPTVTGVSLDSTGHALTATVSVPAKARTGSWDVRVSSADGRISSCSRCAQVQR